MQKNIERLSPSLALDPKLEYSTIRSLRNHRPDIEKARAYGMPENVEKLLKELETPEYVQWWIGKNMIYDHLDRGLFGGLGRIVESRLGDCYRGMLLIYTLLYFRNYDPKVVLLQAGTNSRGQDHNIVVYRGANITGELGYGSVAMSDWDTLMYRPPIFKSTLEVAASYWPSYVSEEPEFRNHNNLKGCSDEINLAKKFGEEGLFKSLFSNKRNATKDIYQHYDDGVWCTDLKTKLRYPYPGDGSTRIRIRELLDTDDR